MATVTSAKESRTLEEKACKWAEKHLLSEKTKSNADKEIGNWTSVHGHVGAKADEDHKWNHLHDMSVLKASGPIGGDN